MAKMMLSCFLLKRSFSAVSSSAATSPLAVLRKKTGYSLSKCKQALVESNNDLEMAQVKLHEQAQKEGWIKSDQSRATTQGVIGTLIDGNKATMIEVNCETDFVAKNNDFLNYVSRVLQVTADALKLHPPTPETPPILHHIKSHDLLSFGPASSNHSTLGDFTAEKIGLFGEKISLTRGCHMTAKTGAFISSFVYDGIKTPGGVTVGKYGSLVHLEGTGSNFNEHGTQLAQHIVGLNPRDIGGGSEDDILTQGFLFEPEILVDAWLKSRDLKVLDFIRYGVGEENKN